MPEGINIPLVYGSSLSRGHRGYPPLHRAIAWMPPRSQSAIAQILARQPNSEEI